MITVTEKWSERRMSLAEPYNCTRVFEVTGTADEVRALTATDESGLSFPALAIPQMNEAHDQNAALYCLGPKIKERPGPKHFVIQCEYVIYNSPALAGQINPLNLPTEYAWGTIELSEPSDHDADGLVICNAVGDVSPQPMPYTLKSLRATKNFPSLDYNWFLLENSVSSAPVTIQGIPVSAQHLRLKQCNPRPFFKGATTFYTVDFDFEVCLTEKLGQSKWPFAHRLLNDADALWCAKTTGGGLWKGAAVDAGLNPLNYRVRLNANGTPTSDFSSVKVLAEDGKSAKSPVAPTAAYPSSEDEPVPASGTPTAVFRYFQKCVRKNLASLPIW